MKPTLPAFALALTAALAAAGAASARADDMPGMHHAVPAAATPAARAYRDAMAKMHAAMDVPYTGDADGDFAAGMIPHHQGAIDMAQVELTYGHDPQMRHLALQIIAAQRQEIALMRRWQAAHQPR